MELYVVFDTNGQCIEYGKVDNKEKPDGSTVWERVQGILSANSKYKVAYFPLATEFNSSMQKIENKKIIAKTPEEIATWNNIEAAKRQIAITSGIFDQLKSAKDFSEFINIFKTIN